ncbi:MAG TPA: ferric reductase-like transmembrane domain-containing protein, partial [Armatimonadota bacterium]|nr:ferric reductase-like transmembrane domain-containing protein [Armatimonadota bacterium]
QPDIAVSVPLVGEVATARVMPSGLRWLVGACFIGVALLALGIAVCIGTHEFPARLGSTDPLIQTLLIVGGRTAATTAAVLFMLQFTLSSRLRVLDQVFGLDRLLVLHRYVGSISGTLAIAHPTLLFASTEYELGPASFEQAKLVGGMIAAGIVTVIVLTSIFRLFLGLKYESWRKIHYLSFALVLFIGVHSLALGADLAGGWTRMVWMGMLAGYALLFVWVKLARPALVRSRGYVVESVDRLSHDTHNLRLKPKGAGFGHVPGQFGFLTLRSGGVKRETHPFTVSTPPTVDGAIDFTIKASGDFTATIREAEPGDEATVEGPYGRFSHVSHGDSDLLLIAGGVGITPFLSQLRYLAATGDTRHITLIWGNKTEGDILLRDELTTLGEKLAGLTVHHVLSAQDDWSGERGYVDAPMLERLLDETARRARAFVCGPPAMMDSVVDALGSIGFASNRIHTERFAFDSELLPPEFRKSPKDD